MTSPTDSLLERAGLASGLLSPEQIRVARESLGDAIEGRDVAEYDQQLAAWLVDEKLLNHWQADQLLRGRTKFSLGPYRIVDAIGYGGMGYVFKGEHTLLGRIEAIKVLPRSQMDPVSVASFCREIRAQAQLDHPNLVRLAFADKEGDTYYLVTEYVPGSDLRRLVRHHGPLSGRQAAVVISQTAEALAYAHARGLVHRDVKPGNLLVTPEGRTKLTDLGLASFASDEGRQDDSLRSGALVGTPDYVAPESILFPNEIRFVSDIYSLGCTLYYAVTGKVPFPGGKTREKLRRHVEEAPITPLRFSPRLDLELVEVIEKMMAKQPEQRIGTAAEVVELLQPWASQALEVTWQELGRYAVEPGAQLLTDETSADTSPAVTRSKLPSVGPPFGRAADVPDDLQRGLSATVADAMSPADLRFASERPSGDRHATATTPNPASADAWSVSQCIPAPNNDDASCDAADDELSGWTFLAVVVAFAALVIGISMVTWALAGAQAAGTIETQLHQPSAAIGVTAKD